ncbi:hypothetical protein B0H16DRAFT_1449132 [Mycena metata]|uniref:Cytochrome P450 n=1 Tax=Mycena metata TaxID=1033252 RepID=A0AAD7K792_9AGAR|nr:hypothetical protein B0H16DRAFT_1449132 [Mycena metata]
MSSKLSHFVFSRFQNLFEYSPRIDLPVSLSYSNLATALFGIFLASTAYQYISASRPLVSPFSIPGLLIPRSRWNATFLWMSLDRKTSYFNHQHDVILMNPILAGAPIIFVGSSRVVQQLLGNEGKLRLVKPVELTLKSLIGDSLASSSGDAWRRHRRILSPAFNAKLYSMAWNETSIAYEEVINSEGWLTEGEVDVLAINHAIHKMRHWGILRYTAKNKQSWLPRFSRPPTQAFVARVGKIEDAQDFAVRNPNYFPDPEVFSPSRWYDADDQVVMFGAGPRQCIGRRFAQSTSIRFLACILRDFDIDVVLQPGEFRAGYTNRVMTDATMAGTSFTLKDVPLKLTRRRFPLQLCVRW